MINDLHPCPYCEDAPGIRFTVWEVEIYCACLNPLRKTRVGARTLFEATNKWNAMVERKLNGGSAWENI